jgi:hypothetical protein
MSNGGAPCIFQCTTTKGRVTPQIGRLHGHEIEAYIEEAEQCCPERSGYAEAASRGPEGRDYSQASSCGAEGGYHPKPSIGGQESREYPQA